MNVSTTLLVILMFTSIVGIGVANILMAFAGHVSTLSNFKGRRLGAAWLLILLLTYLGMFWNSTLIVEREDWNYGLFLFVILGPVLLLFASTLMARLLAGELAEDSPTDLEHALPRFFLIYAAVQAWFIGIDYGLFDKWGTATSVSAALGIAAICLAFSRNRKVIWGFTLLMLALSLLDIVFE